MKGVQSGSLKQKSKNESWQQRFWYISARHLSLCLYFLCLDKVTDSVKSHLTPNHPTSVCPVIWYVNIQTDCCAPWCDEECIHHIGYTAVGVRHGPFWGLTVGVCVHFSCMSLFDFSCRPWWQTSVSAQCQTMRLFYVFLSQLVKREEGGAGGGGVLVFPQLCDVW